MTLPLAGLRVLLFRVILRSTVGLPADAATQNLGRGVSRLPTARPFAEFILSEAEGLRVTPTRTSHA